MQVGVHLPNIGRQGTVEKLLRFAGAAARLGFHSGWVSDHIAWPSAIRSKYPYSDDGSFPGGDHAPFLDPLVALACASAVTEGLRLGTTVLILGHRPPVQTAKAIASLDVLSGGRLILGVGVGWMREEFEALGMPFDHRGARADEQLELMTRLFAEPRPSYHGRFYELPEVTFLPKPPAARIPIWVGGDTEAAFRRVVRYGEVFHAAFTDRDQLARQWARVQAVAAEAGRDPSTIGFSVRLYADFAGTSAPGRSLNGSPDQMIEIIAAYRALGAGHLVLDFIAAGPDARLEALQRFASGVMPHA
jgi:probable F420-dependent oxidoreductase